MKVALIGLGMVSGTHVAALADLSHKVTLRGICARDSEKAERVAAEITATHGLRPQVYPDVAAIAADPDLDAAILCTPPNARADIVATLAAAGKHILMEKPIERTLPAARQIVQTCADAGVTLGIVFQHRMRASAQALADLLASGRLGDMALVEISVPWWREQAYYDEPGRGTYARDGGGVMISQAIHTMDLALSLTGPVTQVQAMASTTALHDMEAEDFVAAGLRFANGAAGSFTASTASFPGATETITIHGTKGSARLEGAELQIHWQDGTSETIGAKAASGGGADPMAFTHEWHQSIIEDFADAVAEARAPIVSGQSALAVHELIDALTRSSAEGRAITLTPSEAP